MTIMLFLLLVGCSHKEPSKEKSRMIVWKTESMKYADMGFILDSGDVISVEIYGAGSALMRLKIYNDRVCMRQFRCMSRGEFNNQHLNSHYPKELLTHIFRSQKIFDGEKIEREKQGFSQKIQRDGVYDILYRVTKQETLFRDRLNNIVIKIKNIK